ncbi:RagB/SusD family nutrient uptake outer membrane protein [Membranihabitans maritimus]|uniref:RagB/SusD family nutrient uptake outer membrane protein n=1 Tax=Membranihabitans maritimus TaxID=2904244 RepID=UPI001F32DEC3|nr:RagB/SusD family nutrient uptake outer membrane protein [Membranihabitans maritimus]
MKKYILLLLLTILFTTSCTDYLKEKPEKSLVVPKTMEDLDRLTNNIQVFNISQPGVGILTSDDLMTTDEGWSGLSSYVERNAYIWDYSKGLENVGEWIIDFRRVYYANIVLEELELHHIDKKGTMIYNMIRGRALFYRAMAYFNLVSLFAQPYEQEKAGQILGLPLRDTPNIDKQYARSSLEDTYQFILEDLETAVDLLPDVASWKSQPSQSVAQALLSRVYLQMGNFTKALEWVEKVAWDNYELLDFNSLDSLERYPIQYPNKEIMYYGVAANYRFQDNELIFIRPELIDQYSKFDLRRSLFFTENEDGYFNYRGSYLGEDDIFGGISLNELYLIRSECLVRKESVEEGLSYLNELLEKRYRNGSYKPYSGLSKEEALDRVLEERRKELVFRITRWLDLRRLNREPGHEVTIIRMVNDQTYQLLPHSNGYVFPIPVDEINLTGIQQNPL